MASVAISRADVGLIIGVRVSPGARRTRVQGIYGGRIKVLVSAPPERQEASQELLRALARWLGLPVRCVTLQAGHTGRDKSIAIQGLSEEQLLQRLMQLAHTAP